MSSTILGRWRKVIAEGSYFELSLDPLCRIDPRGRLLELNRAWSRILGYDIRDLAGGLLLDLAHPDDRTRLRSTLERLVLGRVVTCTLRLRTVTGSYRRFFVRGEPDLESLGGFLVVREIGVYEDRDFIRAVIGTTSALVIVVDARGRVVEWNPAAERATGIEASVACDRFVDELGPFASGQAYYQELTRREPSDFPLRMTASWTRDGETRRIEWHCSVLFDEEGQVQHYVGVGEDVTERHALEAQLLHSQKMEAVGRLAGGIAHDFNNLLSVIGAHSQLVADCLTQPLDAENTLLVQQDVEVIADSVNRASALTRQLLLFGRRDEALAAILDVNTVVSETEKMLKRLLGERIRVQLSLSTRRWSVKLARTHLEQILVNLVVNARDAMPEGGLLRIETRNLKLTDEAAAEFGLPGGRFVEITVRDEGMGMTQEIVDCAFEPFFTTKGAGEGTGLGLSIVYGLVTQYGGAISLESKVQLGTVVRVLLPRERAMPTSYGATDASTSHSKSEGDHVLLVEDDPGVRRAVTRLLKRNGFIVHPAECAEDALRVADATPELQVVLTDVVMPGASGPEMARVLAERHPHLPVVYMSGYAGDFLRQHITDRASVRLLHKPFAEADLLATLNEALGR